MNKLLIILTMSLFACNSQRVRTNKVESSDKILLLTFNESEDYYLGFPLPNKYHDYNIKIRENEKIDTTFDNIKFSFLLSNDTLSFQVFNEYKGYGKFYVPKFKKGQYKRAFDPENYKSYICLYYFYEPIRVGDWNIQYPNSKILRKHYDNEFLMK